MSDNWNKLQAIIQIPIVIIMAWATWETFEMRNASQEQTAKSSMPLVVFDVNKENFLKPIIKNVGYGPALNINISPIKNREFELSFNNVNGIENGGEELLDFEIYTRNSDVKKIFQSDSTQFESYFAYRGNHFMGRTSENDLGTIKITYEDILGNKYSTKQELKFDIVENRIRAKIVEFPKIIN
jgi:hypothetical protein